MKTVFLLALIFAQAIWATINAQNNAQRIEVNITNIQNNEGTIQVGLYKTEKDFLNKIYKGITIKPKKTGVQIVFEDIEPGIYAISLYHDEDDNKKLNTFIMIPTEPYGVSNNAKGQFGPPQWEKAKFTVADKNVIQNISISSPKNNNSVINNSKNVFLEGSLQHQLKLRTNENHSNNFSSFISH